MVGSGLSENRPRRTRTAHILQPTSGGTPVVALQLVAAELAAGLEVVVAGPLDLKDRVISLGATYAPLALRRSPGFHDFRGLLELRKIIKSVDITVLHSSKAMMLGKFALHSFRPSRRPRSIAVPHSWSWNVGGRMAPLYRILERATRNWVDVVVCVSQFEEEQGRDVLGEYPSVIVRNAVDIRYFRPEDRSSHSEDCRLLLVGRLSEQKGQDFFIPLMRDVERATLSLVGEGPDRMMLEDMVLRLGLESRVSFLGECDVAQHYRETDIVVMPSRWEGLSLVLLEAMACGLPVVASEAAAGDFGENHGVVVTDLLGKRFQEAVSRLIEDPPRRMELGRRARHTAESFLGLDQRNDQWLRLLTTLRRESQSSPDSDMSIEEIRARIHSREIGGNGVS